ncbi:MAG: RHS repeat-associated core domain-containing protein, partial [Pirellulales bacterium]
TTLTRDLDGLLTGYGPFTLTRGGPARLPSQVSDGNLDMSLTFDTLARLASRTHTAGGQQVYQVQLTRDVAGRITRKDETVAGTAHTYDYLYNADGQLTEVRRDGAVVERYAYDANGNRISRQVGVDPAEAASYDAQDRLLQRGGVAYQFDVDGYLVQRGGDTFQYSTRGELLQATAGGQTVSYTYDGLARRVGRTDGTGTYQYMYGNPENAFQVTATRAPSGQLTTLFYDEAGLLFALERGGVRFYVAADQVGTPRVVSDAAGQAVKVLEYDSFGSLMADSNPGFDLPVGFAGGLADAATGLVRFGLRDYDPAAVRWAPRDPAVFDGGQANLYAYVNNNPVSLTDATGLTSLEGSLYAGIGVGVKIATDWEGGFSVCYEVGFGVGGGVSVDPFAELDRSDIKVVGELTGTAGFVSASAKLELGDCGFAGEAKGCVGPLCFKTGSEGPGVELNERLLDGKEMFSRIGAKAEGKVAGQFCIKW